TVHFSLFYPLFTWELKCCYTGRVIRGVVLLCVATGALGAESFLSAPASLKFDGIPPIPASLAESLERYGEARSATLLDWHPVKREILIQTRFGDTPQIHRVAMP